jgi:hypothetical protein
MTTPSRLVVLHLLLSSYLTLNFLQDLYQLSRSLSITHFLGGFHYVAFGYGSWL